MTNKANKNGNTSRKTPKTKGQNKSRNQRSRGNRGRQRRADPHLAMVMNPCTSTLVPGLYGSSEGLLSRLKSEFALPVIPAQSTQTCGYFLWCPDFHLPGPLGPSNGYRSINVVAWYSGDPNQSPANDGIAGYAGLFGMDNPASNPMTTATGIMDPTYTLVKENLVADARVLNACLKITYTGKMTDAAGEVGFIQNLPASAILGSQTGVDNMSTPSTVNEVMRYTNIRQRLGTDTLELVYELNELSSNHFRDTDDNLFQQDDPVATPAKGTRLSDPADALSPRLFGFVWRNTLPGAGLSFEMTKSVEWRPAVGSGFTQVPIHTTGHSKVNDIKTTLSKLGDRALIRVANGAQSLSSKIAKAAFTGIADTAYGYLENSIPYVLEAG